MPLNWRVQSDNKQSEEILTLPLAVDVDNLSDTLAHIVRQLHIQSYLEASIDSLDLINDSIYVSLHTGPPYTWSYLDLSQLPALLHDAHRFQHREDQIFEYREIQQLFDALLTKAENNGYPFAAVRLDSIGTKNGQIYAKVEAVMNKKVTLEAIEIQGDIKISKRYLQHFLDLHEGEPFNKGKIINAHRHLQELVFLESQESPVVEFLANGATVEFQLNKKNANQFDILLGLLPNMVENKRFQLTGNVNIDMLNLFGSGEKFHLNYESLQPGTQQLELNLNYPFVFQLPFGIDLQFDLYKRDSTYIDVGYEIGLQYFTKRNNYVKFFTHHTGTDLLSVDTTRILETRRLPDFIDISTNLFGVEHHHENLDYRFNPRRGHLITLELSAGTRKITPNNAIVNLSDDGDPGFSFGSLYNAFDLSSFKYRATASLGLYLPIFRSSAIKLATHTGFIGSAEELYDNELFRIGGAKLLRGFNEETIFANFYSIFTLEYRLLFNENSNLFLFSDLAYTERQTAQLFFIDKLIGFGTGLNLQTKVGIFNISYALGGQKNIRPSFRNGRIHFGMVSSF